MPNTAVVILVTWQDSRELPLPITFIVLDGSGNRLERPVFFPGPKGRIRSVYETAQA